MKENTALALTSDLFQLMKQFPRLKIKQGFPDELTRSEYELLALLVMHTKDGTSALTVTEISNLLQVTPAGVTHLINPLEEVGYVERLPDPNDRRIVRIGPTAKGSQAAEILITNVQENLIGLINHLGLEDSKTLIRLLSKSIEFMASQSKN